MWYKSRLLSVLHGLFHLQSTVHTKMRFLSRPRRLWKLSSIACSAVLAVQALAGTAIAQPALEPTQAPLINEGAPSKQPTPAATAEPRNWEAWHATMSQTPLINEGAPSKQPTPAATAEPRNWEAWHATMSQTPTPKKGCFTATYPNTEWQEVPCTTPPNKPYPPRSGPPPEIVGNGNDFSAQAPSGFISTAIGSFESVNGVTSVSDPSGQSNFSLQLNTNFFTNSSNNVPACNGAANPTACQGWQQFIYSNSGVAFMQYWLINYATTCPTGWNTAGSNCWRNGANGVSVPVQTITNLAQLRLTGQANSGGTDTVIMTTGVGSPLNASNQDSVLNLAQNWQAAEFNIVGDCCSSQANFNAGSTIGVRTRVIYGGTAPPTCLARGFTAETNNLSFGAAPAKSQPGPAVLFTESSTGSAVANCASATTVGDTHLTTLSGLLYDFQASGDFVLAQVDPDFVVQTRQVSGAPRWPNASVNHVVATRMGKTSVAVCLAPRIESGGMTAELKIDGKTTDLGEGKSLSLPDGVDVKRKGNVYLITGESGDSVRAEVNASWINVSVGLGRWPAKVRGLIANANGNVNDIETRDGTVLTNPFPFADLYHRYADSWRVPSNESLLRACGDGEIESGIPTRTFYANDLDPQLYERARAVCITAGVKVGPLLDACTLDVTVIGSDTAAQVFVGAPAPIAVGGIVNTPDNSWKWLMWLVLALVIAFLLGMLFLILRKTP